MVWLLLLLLLLLPAPPFSCASSSSPLCGGVGIVKHHLSLPESAWLRLLLDNSWGPDFHQSCFGMRRGETVPCKYEPGLHNCLKGRLQGHLEQQMQHIWFWPVWPTWPHGPANPTWVTKLFDSGGTVTKLDLAWGHIWGHIELLQEVLSMSRMHSIEVDIGGWVIGCGTQEPPFWKARSNLNFQVHI